MEKTKFAKLVLRKETLRRLTHVRELSDQELRQVVVGSDQRQSDNGCVTSMAAFYRCAPAN